MCQFMRLPGCKLAGIREFQLTRFVIITTFCTIVLWKEMLSVLENSSGDDVGASGHCSLSEHLRDASVPLHQRARCASKPRYRTSPPSQVTWTHLSVTTSANVFQSSLRPLIRSVRSHGSSSARSRYASPSYLNREHRSGRESMQFFTCPFTTILT